MVKPESGEWSEYQRMVLDKLDSLKQVQEKAEDRLRVIETEIALLRLKSSFWGAMAGLGAYGVTMVIQYFQKR
jgi:hypothetical protein